MNLTDARTSPDEPGTKPPRLSGGREVTQMIKCQCGLAIGEPCEWVGPVEDTVIVEWMPECFRASHRAAGNKGIWPHNGAIRFRAERSCAEMLVEDHGEWAEILGPDAALLEED